MTRRSDPARLLAACLIVIALAISRRQAQAGAITARAGWVQPPPVQALAPARASAPGCDLPWDNTCEAWVATYDDSAHALDTPRNLSYATQTIAVSPDGSRVYVTGSSWGGDPAAGGTHYDMVTIAYAAGSGAQLWIARYSGPGNSQDSGWALAVSADGSRLFVTGMSHQGVPNWDYATVAYDAETGEQLWVARYDATNVDRAWSLALSPAGDQVFVTGDSGGNYGTVAYDAASGTQQWVALYDGGSGYDVARFVGASSDGGRVFVTGVSSGGAITKSDYATVAYDADSGAQQWVMRYNSLVNGDDWAFSLGISPDGERVFVTGWGDGSVISGLDYATICYLAATGEEQWTALYDGPAHQLDAALSLAVNHAGTRVFVTGYSTGTATSYDYGTVAYDAGTGVQQWVARYNGPALNNSDNGYDVAVAMDDDLVFVTGESPPLSTSDNYDIATLAYDAESGAEQWVARYTGPEGFQDGAFAVEVNPDGSALYVNGESWHATTPGQGDYATLAYALDGPTATIVSLINAQAEPGCVRLAWHATETSGATVQRREAGSEWRDLGEVAADGNGKIRFEDRDVAGGGRYGYRLAVRVAGVAQPAGEVWVDVPRWTLSLDRLEPNPIAGADVIVGLTLPSDRPARVELFDVAGRVVAARDLGALGAGPHRVRLGVSSTLAPGIYWVRLAQDGAVAFLKAAVLR
jgi:hypothetical protein